MEFKENWMQAIADFVTIAMRAGQYAPEFTVSDVQRVLTANGVVIEKAEEDNE